MGLPCSNYINTPKNHLIYKAIEGEDDAARINDLQSRFTAGEGGTIVLPSPEYFGSQAIVLKEGVRLEGCWGGRTTRGYGTQIESTSPTVVLMSGRHSSVARMNLRSNADNAKVVHIRGGREMLVQDVWTTSSGDDGTGVYIEGGDGYGSYVNKIVRTHSLGLDVGVHVFGTLTDGVRRANHNALWGCSTNSCNIGVLAEECDFLQLFSHHAESNRDSGLKVLGRSIRTSASQSYFENAIIGNSDIDATGTSGGGNGWVKLIACRYGSIIDPLNKVEII